VEEMPVLVGISFKFYFANLDCMGFIAGLGLELGLLNVSGEFFVILAFLAVMTGDLICIKFSG